MGIACFSLRLETDSFLQVISFYSLASMRLGPGRSSASLLDTN
jgi:hypothetical protein